MTNKKKTKEIAKETPVTPEKDSVVELWDKIKNVQINLFAFQSKPLSDFVDPQLFGTGSLFLTPKPGQPGMLIVAIENALGRGFIVENKDKYISITVDPNATPTQPYVTFNAN